VTQEQSPSTFSHPDALRGRAVVVTGAAQGVGLGITRALAKRGASVLVVDLQSEVAQVAAGLVDQGYDVRAMVQDITAPGSAEAIVTTAVEAYGALHGLVNNAVATREPKRFADIENADYDLVYDTGPRATFRLMQAAYPHLVAAGGGSIVNLGSGSGTAGMAKFGAYGSAKEAIRGMSKVAAAEWARDGIRVNTVCPFAQTEGMDVYREVAPADYDKVVRTVPMRRLADPEGDVGALVAFLLGDDSRFITAQTINVDGGTGSFR
jgi:NAD(P)-dependent dehydrogenase (short-subunit alcohol dehydrogenase family)